MDQNPAYPSLALIEFTQLATAATVISITTLARANWSISFGPLWPWFTKDL